MQAKVVKPGKAHVSHFSKTVKFLFLIFRTYYQIHFFNYVSQPSFCVLCSCAFPSVFTAFTVFVQFFWNHHFNNKSNKASEGKENEKRNIKWLNSFCWKLMERTKFKSFSEQWDPSMVLKWLIFFLFSNCLKSITLLQCMICWWDTLSLFKNRCVKTLFSIPSMACATNSSRRSRTKNIMFDWSCIKREIKSNILFSMQVN